MADLHRIRAYIGQDNPYAGGVATGIIAACDRLVRFLERGRPGLVAGTRELTSTVPYVIVYRVLDAVVEVLRVWHGAQDRSHRPATE